MIDKFAYQLIQTSKFAVAITLAFVAGVFAYKFCKRIKQMYLDSLSPQERHEWEERQRQRENCTEDTGWSLIGLAMLWSWFFK